MANLRVISVIQLKNGRVVLSKNCFLAPGAWKCINNSIDRDGQGKGIDVELVKSVVNAVEIPDIALGGVGAWAHIAECIDKASPGAVAASNIFQNTENGVYNANKYLFEKVYQVRKPSIKRLLGVGYH